MLRKKPFGVALVLAALVFVMGGTAVFADPDSLAVSFEAEVPEAPTCGLTVEFDATVTGGVPPYTFDWDFDDGSTSDEEDPVHTYAVADEYTVTLTVTDSAETPDEASDTETFTVFEPVTATATADPEEDILEGNPPMAMISFTGDVSGGVSPYTFEWDFDDGSPMSTDQNPTHEYDEVGTYEVLFTVEDDNGCVGTDTVTVVISSEEALNPVGEALASYFDVPNDVINELHEDGSGYGEIAFAYWLSWITGEDDVEFIMGLRDDMGWGQIFKELLDSSLGWLNLGAIMSGQAEARLEALAEECDLTVEELQELFQETDTSPITMRHACRVAAETDGEVSVEDILEMHEDGMSWGAIRQALALPAACGLEWEEVQEFLDDFSLADIRHACRLAAASGGEFTVGEILDMRVEDSMSWGAIRQEVTGSGPGSDEATTTDTSSHGQGHGKGGNPNK